MRRLGCLMLLILLAGCGTRHVVSVDGLAGDAPRESLGARVLVLPLELELSPDDPQFRALAAQLGPALRSRGLEPAADGADYAVYLGYGRSGPRTDHVTIRGPAWREPLSADHPLPTGSFNVRLSHTFSEERSWTLYTYSLDLAARALPAPGGTPDTGRLLWKLHALCLDPEERALEAMFPLLLLAARPYIGTDTDGVLDVELAEDGGDVRIVNVQ